MSWESLVAFAVIAFVSSLFNKGKNQTTNRRTTNPPRPINPTRPVETTTSTNPSRPMPQRTTVQRPTNQTGRPVGQQPSKRPRTTGGLEEMLRELQKNMGEVFQQSMGREVPVKPDSPVKNQAPEEVKETPKTITQTQPTTTPIVKKEIGRESIGNVRFDRQSLLQGVIMSEVLGKPKSLRK